MPGRLLALVFWIFPLALASLASEADWQACSTGKAEARLAACARILAEPGLSASDRLRAEGERAKVHFARKSWDALIAGMDAALAHQQDASLFFWRGAAYAWKGRPDEAIRDLDQAIRLNPRLEYAFVNRAWMHGRKGDYERGIADANAALALDPRNLSARNTRGYVYEQKGAAAEALADYRQVIASAARPGNDDDHSAKRFARTNLDRLEKAVAALEGENSSCQQGSSDARMSACGRVIANPLSSSGQRIAARMARASVHGEHRQYEAVIAELDELLKLDPKNAIALNRRGSAKVELNRPDQAAADFDLAIAADPAFPNPLNNRGNIYRNQGNLERALEYYAAALRLEPNYLYPLRNRGYAYERMGYFAEAERIYRQVVAAPGRPASSEDLRAKREAEGDLKRLAGIMEARTRSDAQIVSRAALVIANSRYRGSFEALRTPKADARALADALKRLGFKGEDVVEKYDLDRRGMIAALREFEARAKSADWAFVFFAGHGVRARSGLDFLIPVDARIESESDLEDEAVALERVQQRISDAKKLQLIMFDACRSNELTRRLYGSEGLQRSAVPSKAPFEAPGLMLAFSARRGQSAFDGKINSPFVEGLLANIERPGADLEMIFEKTAEHVRKATQERQTPEIFGLSYGKGLLLKPAAVAAQK